MAARKLRSQADWGTIIDKVIAQNKTPAPATPEPDEDENEPDENEGGPPNPMNTPMTTAPLVELVTPPPTNAPVTPRPGSAASGGAATTSAPLTPAKPTSNSGSSNEINTQNTSKSDGGSGGIVRTSAMVAALLVVVCVIAFIVRKRRSKATAQTKSLTTPDESTQQSTRYANGTVLDNTAANYTNLPDTKNLLVLPRQPQLQHSSSAMSEDPDITTMRIPMEKVELGHVISRGGFGEVYRGTYKGEPVAIKRLLPDRRKDLRQIDAFLTEAKLMGALEHERIVQFIGVAWDSLAEVCVVSEFMEGGDLRSVLVRWETSEHRLHGFDHDKIKIALHVAHAMTYLHSLQPIVLHRDLKSKNILLTHDYNAKITDFGVSRERNDATMTAGVGSSLWMAPEVMMGERYDEKADVFSFGAVLSELDTHLLPYSHAVEPGTGRKIPDTAILQMVTMGRLSVEFTDGADEDMVSLGRDCVQLDPTKRPTAGEVLHRVHTVWRSCVSL